MNAWTRFDQILKVNASNILRNHFILFVNSILECNYINLLEHTYIFVHFYLYLAGNYSAVKISLLKLLLKLNKLVNTRLRSIFRKPSQEKKKKKKKMKKKRHLPSRVSIEHLIIRGLTTKFQMRRCVVVRELASTFIEEHGIKRPH